MLRRSLLGFLAAASLGGCGWISFDRRMSLREFAAQAEIKAYYDEVKNAFAARDAEALAALYDPGITQPLTYPQIRDWARRFFAGNENVRFRVETLRFERLGAGRATVLLAYEVTTRGGKGDFAGTEIDELEKRDGSWRIISWRKAAD